MEPTNDSFSRSETSVTSLTIKTSSVCVQAQSRRFVISCNLAVPRTAWTAAGADHWLASIETPDGIHLQ